MKITRIERFAVALLLAAGVTAVMLRAQTTQPSTQPAADSAAEAAATQPSAHISTDAKALLDKVSEAYAKLQGIDLAGTVSIQFDGGGQKRDDHADFTSSFRSPNKFRHDIKDEDTIISTGEKLYAYLNKKNQYLELDAPKSRGDGIPDQVGELVMDQDPSLFLVMATDAGQAVTQGASDVSLGDDVDINGTKFAALKILSDEQDTRVLIDRNTLLLRQVRHDLSRSMKSRGVPNVTTALATIDYTHSTPSNAPGEYAWTPPADAKPMKPAADEAGGGNASALEGKPAPAFSLNGLDGKPVTLASLKDHVVILDYWATWCGPCREGLPIIDKIAKARAADGVKVFAVNLQEDNAQVAAFLKQQNLSLPALLDSDGAVAKQYGVDGIPQTVIIGKDGVVRKVVVGLAPDEEQMLNRAVDAALNGK